MFFIIYLFRNIFILDVVENFCYYFKKLMVFSNEYRYVYEYGDVSIIKKDELEV